MVDITKVAKKYDVPHKVLMNLLFRVNCIKISKFIDVFAAICRASDLQIEIPPNLTNQKLAEAVMKTMNTAFENQVHFRVDIIGDYRYPDVQYFTHYIVSQHKKSFEACKSWTPEETAVFFQIFNFMFLESKNRGEIPASKALNMAPDILKPKDADEFLNNLVKSSLLTRDPSKDTYALHSRGALELIHLLRSPEYNNPMCPVCLRLILRRRLSTVCEVCEIEVHNACIDGMVRKAGKHGVKCPGRMPNNTACTAKLENVGLTFEKDPTTESTKIDVVSTRVGRRSRPKKPRLEDDAEEEVESEEDDDEEEADEEQEREDPDAEMEDCDAQEVKAED